MKRLRTYYKLGVIALLVTMFAGLLPAQSSFARSSQLTPSLSGDLPVDATPAEVRAQFWVANALQRVDGPQRAEMVAFELVLMHLYKQNPDLPSDVAVQKIHDLQAAYQNSSQANLSKYAKTANENTLAIFAVLSGLSPSASPAVVAAAQEAYALTLRDSLTGATYGADRILGASETFFPSLAQDRAQQTLLRETLDFAQNNQRFGEAFDALWKDDLHVRTSASTAQIIQSSEALQSLPSLINLIDDTGKIHAELATLQTMTAVQLTVINAATLSNQQLLLELDAHQTSLSDYVHNEAAKQADKARADAAKSATTKLLDSAEAAFNVLIPLIKKADPRFANSLEVVGKATFTVAKAVSEYAAVVAGLDIAKALISFDTVTLVGKIAGAVLSLLPLFGDQQTPEPNQMILEQIGQLRHQVERLGQQMNGRFDRLDKAINTLYTTINIQFAKINLQLGIIADDIHDIKLALTQVQQQLNRIEQRMFDLLSVAAQHELLTEINGKIGYREIHDGADISDAAYNHAENLFQTWAILHSSDPLATVQPPSVYDDLALYDQLNNYPLDANINYLSRYINWAWGLPALSSSLIANPRVWSLSARAYTELELDWPAWALAINAGRADAVLQKGQAIQAALRHITTLDGANGPANYPLFTKLIDNYKAKAASFNQEVQQRETTYLQGLPVIWERTGIIDPWGGITQTIDLANISPLFPQFFLCGHTDAAKATPILFAQKMLPKPFQVAQYLAANDNTQAPAVTDSMRNLMAKLSACYDAHWVDIRSVSSGGAEPHDIVYAKLQVDLFLNYTSGGTTQTLSTWTIKRPEQVIDANADAGPPQLDPQSVAKAQWQTGSNTIKAAFEASPVAPVINPVPEDASSSVADALKGLQRIIYQRVIDQLAQVSPVADAAKRLSGAKALLVAFTALGLPHALETNEYLRSLLYGDQGLLDEGADKRLTGQWAAAKVTPPDHNVRPDIKALMDQRADALKEALWHYLDEIDAHHYGESHRMIDTTLDRLKIANAIVRTPILSLSAGSLSFGYQLVGAPSATRTITLTNSGAAAPISISAISLAGANAADFAKSSTCGASLAAGARCTITLTFTPAAPVDRAAELRIADSAPGAPHSVSLAGKGWQGAAFNAPASVAEGSPINLSLTDPSNPSQWEPSFSFAFDCGSGSGYGAFGPGNTATCPTTDNGTRAVKGKVKDQYGVVTEYSASVAIANVAPTASFSAPASVAEGSWINLALQNAVDPSSADMASLSYAFDCGSGYGPFGSSKTTACATTDNGTRAVKGKVKDKDGGVTEYGASVTVANVAPTASFQAPNSVNTGNAIILTLANPVDAPGDLPSLQYAFDCGDGTGYGAFSANSSASCVANAAGTRTVKGQVKDKDGAITEYSATVTIVDVLSLRITSPGEGDSFVAGTPVALTASFTDRIRRTTHICIVNWGDGTDMEQGIVTEGLGAGKCDAEHIYAAPGQYTIEVNVKSSNGYSIMAAVTILVKPGNM